MTTDQLDRWSSSNWAAVAGSFERSGAAVPDAPAFTDCVADLRADKHYRRLTDDEQRRDECARQHNALRRYTLQMLISERWIEAEARERGWTADKDEMEAAARQEQDQLLRTEEDLQIYARNAGLTEADVRHRLLVAALSKRLLSEVIAENTDVSEAEIQEQYDRRRADYRRPIRRDLAMIQVGTRAQADAVRSRIEAGETWPAVVEDVVGEGGAYSAVFGRPSDDSALSRAVVTADVGDIVGPVRAGEKWAVFEVLEVTPAGAPPLEDIRQDVVSDVLTKRERQRVADANADVLGRWRNETRCVADLKVPECGGGELPGASAP